MDDRWPRIQELRRMLKADWARLWRTKREDEIKAEGISIKNFEKLFVDRGEIIHATRDFKPLSFREIFEKNVGTENANKVVDDPRVGGWGKFMKDNFPVKSVMSTKREKPGVEMDLNQQQRKDGDGWLNKGRIWKKIKYRERDY